MYLYEDREKFKDIIEQVSNESVNLSGKPDTHATLTSEGRINNRVIRLEDIEKISGFCDNNAEENLHKGEASSTVLLQHRQH